MAPAHEQPVCWICLDGTSAPGNRLLSPCSCPRHVHERCISRWQLQKAGHSEEASCRFCGDALPDWRAAMGRGLTRDVAIMTVTSPEGQHHLLAVRPGEAGRLQFEADVRRIYKLTEDQEPCISFDCRVPGTGESVELIGWEAFEAAVHCASISAGKRAAAVARQRPAAAVAATQQQGTFASMMTSLGTRLKRFFAVQQHSFTLAADGRIQEAWSHY